MIRNVQTCCTSHVILTLLSRLLCMLQRHMVSKERDSTDDFQSEMSKCHDVISLTSEILLDMSGIWSETLATNLTISLYLFAPPRHYTHMSKLKCIDYVMPFQTVCARHIALNAHFKVVIHHSFAVYYASQSLSAPYQYSPNIRAISSLVPLHRCTPVKLRLSRSSRCKASCILIKCT